MHTEINFGHCEFNPDMVTDPSRQTCHSQARNSFATTTQAALAYLINLFLQSLKVGQLTRILGYRV